MAKPAPPPKNNKAKPPPAPKAVSPVTAGKSHKPRTVKNFSVTPMGGDADGEKVIMYGQSGIGKTTLAMLAPNPVFIALDDGARKLRMPDGSRPQHIPGIETFDELRAVLQTSELFDSFESVIVDTLTRVEIDLALPWMFANVKRDGSTMSSIEQYGWGKGHSHMLETMRLLLMDFDALVRRGKNVILLCQSMPTKVANAEGLDFIQDGPKLNHYAASNLTASVRFEFCEWADHVVAIRHLDNRVTANKDAKVGKLEHNVDDERAVYTSGARHFVAKTRTIREPVISFADPTDASFWTYMFRPEEIPNDPE
jgi:hypothetical protein